MNLFKNKNLFSITEEIKQEISKNYKKINTPNDYANFIKTNYLFKNNEMKKEIVNRLIHDKDFLKNIVEDDYLISKHNHYFTEKVYDFFTYFIVENLSFFVSKNFNFHPDTFLKPLLESKLINYYSMLLSDLSNLNNDEKEKLKDLENIIYESLLNNYFSHITTTILFLSKKFQIIINKIIKFHIENDETTVLSHFKRENIKNFIKRYEQDKNDINTFIGFYLSYINDEDLSFDLINFIHQSLSEDKMKYDLFNIFKEYQNKKEIFYILFMNSPSLSDILHEDIFLFLNIYIGLCPINKNDFNRIHLIKTHFPRVYNRHMCLNKFKN